MEPSENQHFSSEHTGMRNQYSSKSVLYRKHSCLTSAPFWSDFKPKIRVAAFLRYHKNA